MMMTQARHAKAMAKKIQSHLQAMQWAMKSIAEEPTDSLENVSVDVAHKQFRILERRWEEIQSVLRDMEPEL